MLKLVRWRWKEKEMPISMEAFRGKIDYLFKRLTSEHRYRSLERSRFAPAVDVSETYEEIIVRAEVPGVDPKDLDVSINGNTLRLSGIKLSETEEEGEKYHRVERSFGSFSVSLSLPCQVQEDKIEFEQKNGILLLKILKAQPEATAQERLEVTQTEQAINQQHRQITG